MTYQDSNERLCELEHPTHPDKPSRCGPAAYICLGHIRKLKSNLRDMPVLHELLASVPISWEQQIGYSAASADSTIPYSDEAADHRQHMVERAGSWVRIIAKARNFNPPSVATPGLTADSTVLRSMCSWLLSSADWAADHPEYAKDFAEAMAEVTSWAWSLNYPNRLQEIPLDPCIETPNDLPCPGHLFAMMRPKDELFPKYIACNTCDVTIDSKDWYRYGLKLWEAREKTAADAA